MSIKVGQEVFFLIGTKQFAAITSHDVTFSNDMLETTNMQTPNLSRTYRKGRYNTSFNFEGLHDPDANTTTYETFFTLLAVMKAGTEVTLTWGSQTNGEKRMSMSGILTSISPKAQDNAVITISGSYQGTGAITVATS
jgi:hypothetical protein